MRADSSRNQNAGTAAILLPAVLLCAFGLRVWGISYGLPDMSHGDETEVVNHAVRFGNGDLNPHRFQYGSLMQYLLFVLYGVYFIVCFAAGQLSSVRQFAVEFIRDPTVFYLIARTVSALFGTATVYLVYRIGRQVRSPEAGLYAALFLAVCFQHVVHSHYCTVDITMTFFFTLAVYFALRLFESAGILDYCAAGLAVGLAVATKFDGVFAVSALVCAHFFRGGNEDIPAKILSPKLWLAGACVPIGHFLACPFFYIEIDAALREAFELRKMHTFEGFNLAVYIRRLAADYVGIPLGALCVGGLLLGAATRSKKLATIIITAAAVLCFKSMHRYVESKYILHSLPLLAVCGAALFSLVCERLKPAFAAVACMLLIAHPLYCSVDWAVARSRQSIDLQARQWIEEHIPAGSRILLDNIGNKGPKLANNPANIERQLQRARRHGLMKAEHLELQLEIQPDISYDLVYVYEPGGFRDDDFRRYLLWQDLEKLGMPPEFYREKEFDFIVITERYYSLPWNGFRLVREFHQDGRGVRIYRVE